MTDKEYQNVGVGVIKVAVVAFAMGVLIGYLIS